MNLFERAVRVIKSYANAIVTSAEVRCVAHATDAAAVSGLPRWGLTRAPAARLRTQRRCWSRR